MLTLVTLIVFTMPAIVIKIILTYACDMIYSTKL